MQRIIAAALAAASIATTATAQTGMAPVPAPTPVLQNGSAITLDDVIRSVGVDRPIARSPQQTVPPPAPALSSAAAGIEAAQAARRVAGLRPNPQIQGQFENVIGSGPYRGTSSAETTVALGVPLELGGKRPARIALATARLSRAEIQAEIARADLRLRITQLYVDTVAAERRAQVLGEQAGIAANTLRIATARIRVGAVSPIEGQRAEVLQINAQIAADNAAREAEASRLNLATVAGQPIVGPLDFAWFDRVQGYGPVQPIAVDGTLALAAAQADVKSATAQVRVAQSLRVPDVTVSAGARRLEATKDIAAVFGVTIPFPVFNNGSALVAQSRSEERQAVAQRNLAVIDTQQAITQAQTEVANAAATARAAGGPGLAAAQEAARIARIGWAQGKFDQIALLDAERTLSLTRQAHVDALAAYHNAQARLERLTTPASNAPGENR